MKLQDFDFRIWNPEVGVYGVLYGDLTFKGKINKRSVAIIPLESESLEIELFTGFCDKNGKKIYEGDIVRYREQNLLISYERATWYIIDPSIDEDIRVDCGTRLQGILECMKYHQNIDTENQIDIEVIGNIHENSELLNY